MGAAVSWVVLGVLLVLAWLAAGRRPLSATAVPARVPRVLRPRAPDDCPDCRRPDGGATDRGAPRPPPHGRDPGGDPRPHLLAPGARGRRGAALARRVKAASPGTRVFFLALHQDPAQVGGWLAAGADGYALKQAAVRGLPGAIRAVAAGVRTCLGGSPIPTPAAGLAATTWRRTRDRPPRGTRRGVDG